jgi:hypothetical protein
VDNKDKNRPSLRRASTGSGDPTSPSQQGDSTTSADDKPTLHRREDQQN